MEDTEFSGTRLEDVEEDVDVIADIESGGEPSTRKTYTMWRRILNVFNVLNRVRPLASSNAHRKDNEEKLRRRNSFLNKFSMPGRSSGIVFDSGARQICEEANDSRCFGRLSCEDLVVDPEGNAFYIWLGIVSLAWLYSVWSLIVRQAFFELQDYSMMVIWFIIDYSFDFIYVLDIVIQLRTGYLENGLLVYESGKLAKNYIYSRWFFVDLLSLLPLDLLYLISGATNPLLRFPRFFKVYRAKSFYRRAESRTSWPNFLRVMNLTHTLMLLMHWFACFYYMISETEGFIKKDGLQRGWAYPLPDNVTEDSAWSGLRRKYLHSIYWSCLTLTTIGEKQSPDTDLQYLCTLAAYFLGIFAFATVVGQVGSVISNKNVDRLEFERLVDNAKYFMKTKGVAKDMQKRILRWYDYSWSRGILRGASDVNSLGMIPDTLKVELAIRVNMDTLRKVSIFKIVQREFLYAIVLKMRSFVFTPGDLVCRKGEVAKEMFIIHHGLLHVMNDAGNVVATLAPGDFFGEIGILNIANGVNKRMANVVSVGYSEVFSLAGKDVLRAMKYYPEAKNLLLLYGRQRLNETNSSDTLTSTETLKKHVYSSCNSSARSSSSSNSPIQATKENEYKKRKNHLRKATKESFVVLSMAGATAAAAASLPDGHLIKYEEQPENTLDEDDDSPVIGFKNLSLANEDIKRTSALHLKLEEKIKQLNSVNKKDGLFENLECESLDGCTEQSRFRSSSQQSIVSRCENLLCEEKIETGESTAFRYKQACRAKDTEISRRTSNEEQQRNLRESSENDFLSALAEEASGVNTNALGNETKMHKTADDTWNDDVNDYTTTGINMAVDQVVLENETDKGIPCTKNLTRSSYIPASVSGECTSSETNSDDSNSAAIIA